ncbi:hypothetical protein JXB12_04110 [candidate division KSB1 bacterium]|nr:hypothetical protein [candidate division KSB1 bacterium]
METTTSTNNDITLETDTILSFSQKVHILFLLFHGLKISHLLDELDNSSVIDLQRFIWEKTVEIGIKTHGKNFNRDEITRKMTPSAEYQRLQNCTEPLYYCKGTACINSHPHCARKKIKEHLDIMADTIWEYLSYDV